ncbi:MAG: LPS assembly lipoprotein LptE [Hyphomicrobiaceae bacterium]
MTVGLERQRRFLKVAGALAICGLIAGCGTNGFSPMYASSIGSISLSEKLKQVEITTIPGRVGQRIRNELIFQNTGGDYELAPRYQLDITLTERLTSTLVNKEGDSRSQIYTLNAKFVLLDSMTKKPIIKGTSFGRASFERFSSIFSNVQARQDAENRAARSVSQDIKSRLEAVLAST